MGSSLGRGEARCGTLSAVDIYLDHNATTPVPPQVVEAMAPFLFQEYGNPSSRHSRGRAAQDAVGRARERVAAFLGAAPAEIVFTASGSESNNLAIRGAALGGLTTGRRTIVTQATEHPSVLAACHALSRLHGFRLVTVGVDRFGSVDLDELRGAVDQTTLLVSIQVANGETGTLQPIREVADIARRCGAVFHADACQAAGKVGLDVRQLGVDLLSVAGHKMYGPKGVGALYRRDDLPLEPVIYGGGQEHGARAGTENVSGVVGLSAACDVAERAANDGGRVRLLRDTLFEALRSGVRRKVCLNGHPTDRLPNTLNVSIDGLTGRSVLACADGVAASTGSACHADKQDPSPVLTAMGCDPDRALGAVRLSLGDGTQADELRRAVYILARATSAAAGTDTEAVHYAVY